MRGHCRRFSAITVSGSGRGRAVLNALVQNRLAVEEKFRTWRPADFADALRRWPPAQRKTLREKMDGVALILLPDSFPDKKYVM